MLFYTHSWKHAMTSAVVCEFDGSSVLNLKTFIASGAIKNSYVDCFIHN